MKVDNVGQIECWDRDMYPEDAEWADDDILQDSDEELICHFWTADQNERYPADKGEIPHAGGPTDEMANVNPVAVDRVHTDAKSTTGHLTETVDPAHHAYGQLRIGQNDTTCRIVGDGIHCGDMPRVEFGPNDTNHRK